jgi:hypothetical protein
MLSPGLVAAAPPSPSHYRCIEGHAINKLKFDCYEIIFGSILCACPLWPIASLITTKVEVPQSVAEERRLVGTSYYMITSSRTFVVLFIQQ